MKGAGELADGSISTSIWESTVMNLLFMRAYLQEIEDSGHSGCRVLDNKLISAL